MDELEDILQRIEAGHTTPEDCEKIRQLSYSYVHLLDLLKDEKVKVGRLRKLLFGASTEKTDSVLGEQPESESTSENDSASSDENEEQKTSKPPRPGHGRNGADAFGGGDQVEVHHESLQPGDSCPECRDGTLYDTKPGVLVRIVARPPLHSTVYRLQKLRCHLCGRVFKAKPPKEAGEEKYDATARSMIALLKYGTGMPFNRLAGLQGGLDIPLPASTQCELVQDQAKRALPAYKELIRQAAAGDVCHNDDTAVKILEYMGKRAKKRESERDSSAKDPDAKDSKEMDPSRTGLFTSGIVSTREGRRIALFFSGRQHAGENLRDVLLQRDKELPPVIQMSDALSRNLPGELETIVANCLTHGRRRFVDVKDQFPEECRYVLEALRHVYHTDALARERELSPEDRLALHQAESGPVMEDLHAWLSRQFDDRLVEPNSSLGGAITYMLKHWKKLTLFLRVPGAPLDNNICERALKMAIRHRRNSLFFKTQNGAEVGDLFMSLIHTCALCDANPFDYLTELDRHADQLASSPSDWMPWNYRQTLARAKPMPAAG
jgi:transposase